MAPKKDSAHYYGYGWYNEKQLEDYYNKIIGNFFNNVSIAKLTISLCLLHISLRWAIKLALCTPWELEADGLADPGCVDRHPDAVRGRTMPAVW